MNEEGDIPPDAFVRRIVYLMVFRVGLVTLLLGATVVMDIVWYGMDSLSGPFARFLFILIGATYALNLLYVAFLGRVSDPHNFGMAQIAGDLAITSLLVHATGGASSAFVFLYPLSALAASILFYRRGAILTAIAGSALFVFVSLGGYRGLLPPIPGQTFLPWNVENTGFATAIMTSVSAIFAVALLGSYLAGELRRAFAQVESQSRFIGDLSALNAAIVRGLRGGLISADLDGRILIENQAAREILGAGATPLAGRTLAEAVPELAGLIDRGKRGLPIDRTEVTLARGAIRRLLGVSVAPLADHRGTRAGHIVSFQDITAERELQQALERAERLASVGRVAAGIAHELRNPLASISGSIELLARIQDLTEEDRQLMGIVLREIERLSALVGGLLEYASPHPPAKAPVDLGELLSDVVRVLSADPARGVRFDLAASRTVVEGDSQQLRQVVWNLLRNAVEASPDGGVIEVRSLELDGRAGLRVRDQGAGVPQEVRQRIFEPFFTTKRGGTGLGLALVHRIVDQHGGTVEIAPPGDGAGATFTVWLPKAGESRRD